MSIDKKVRITGRKGRYIPVTVKAGKTRNFVIDLLTTPHRGRKQKTLSSLTAQLEGKATLRLSVPKSVTTGTYEIEVRVFRPGRHGKQTGKSIKQVFVLS